MFTLLVLAAPVAFTDSTFRWWDGRGLDYYYSIFEDDFESGTTDAWSMVVGRLSGIVALTTERDDFAFTIERAATEASAYPRRAKALVIGVDRSGATLFLLSFRRTRREVEVRLVSRLDDGSWARSAWVEAAVTMELEWRRAWGPGFEDGELLLSSDGGLLTWLTDLDTDRQRLIELRVFSVEGHEVVRLRLPVESR